MDLESLNSATKYPSIPCYHAMQDRGRLADVPSDLPAGRLLVTEKIDGTNSRIIVNGRDYFIGSREELLYAKGDRIGNPSMGIVDGIKDTAERITAASADNASWRVYYGEFYGRNVGSSAKQYAKEGVGFRVFDIADFQPADFSKSPRECAAWRDGGGQRFLDSEQLATTSNGLGLTRVPAVNAELPVPKDHAGVLTWLQRLAPRTLAALDADAGIPEGVVIRTPDRRVIVKIRLEDYQRHLKRKT